jgi:Ca2+/Na+ antiporter
MNVLGTILAIAIVAILSIVLAPVGGIVLLAATLVMVLKVYQQNRQIADDLQKIKEKLNIVETDDFNLPNEVIEEELEREWNEHKNE